MKGHGEFTVLESSGIGSGGKGVAGCCRIMKDVDALQGLHRGMNLAVSVKNGLERTRIKGKETNYKRL